MYDTLSLQTGSQAQESSGTASSGTNHQSMTTLSFTVKLSLAGALPGFSPALAIPSSLNYRLDQVIRIAYSQEVYENLYLQPFFRFQYTLYTNNASAVSTINGRNDFLYTAGLNVNYVITDWASVRLFFNYDKRESDSPAFADYEVFNGGGGATVVLSF